MIIINSKTALPFSKELADQVSYAPEYWGLQSNTAYPGTLWGEDRSVVVDTSHDYLCVAVVAPDGAVVGTGDGYNLTPDKEGYCIETEDGVRHFSNIEDLMKHGRIGDRLDESSLICNDYETNEIVEELYFPNRFDARTAVMEVSQSHYELVSASDAKKGVEAYRKYMAERKHRHAMRNDDVYAARYLRSIGDYAAAKQRVMGIEPCCK